MKIVENLQQEEENQERSLNLVQTNVGKTKKINIFYF
jgi:hypothetical protein